MKMEDSMNMKRMERKGRIFQTVIAICMVFNIIMLSPSVSYAQAPTLYSEFATFIVGANDMKVENYNGSQVVAGCFTAPEKGNYKFSAVNTGELRQDGYLLDNNFAKIDYYNTNVAISDHRNLTVGEKRDFDTYSLEKGEKIYFYVLAYDSDVEKYGKESGILAVRFVVEKEKEKKPEVVTNTTPSGSVKNKKTDTKIVAKKLKVSISKKTCTLKKGKKIKLKLKNNKKKVIWVSREKKIASVTSKGVVKGRKKGITYIYAIANHKLYKCKVKVK